MVPPVGQVDRWRDRRGQAPTAASSQRNRPRPLIALKPNLVARRASGVIPARLATPRENEGTRSGAPVARCDQAPTTPGSGPYEPRA